MKHLENTLIEIPKDTIALWVKDAQQSSMNLYNRVELRHVETYLKLKTDGWRLAERMKNAWNENYLIIADSLDEKDKRILELENQVEMLKRQIR